MTMAQGRSRWQPFLDELSMEMTLKALKNKLSPGDFI
jgi:hypothetical protein